MTQVTTNIRYVVSGTDQDGTEREWAIEASTVESAAQKARGHGMAVRSVTTEHERESREAKGPQEVELVGVDRGAAIFFGFWAAIGAAFVLVVIAAGLMVLAWALGGVLRVAG